MWARAAVAAGRDTEDILRDLRTRGVSKVGCVYCLSVATGIRLDEAKAAVFQSAAWADQREEWADQQRDAFEALVTDNDEME
jgi:hypothetical protein